MNLCRASIAFGLSIMIAGTALADNKLVGRAVLPADTFAEGPTSGQYIAAANGRTPPFIDKQPVQGFSAVLDNRDGTFLAMSDNGFGSLENSADYHLRVYHIAAGFETRFDDDDDDKRKSRFGASGQISVFGFFELSDPDRKIPFAIVNHFSEKRILTGADFDIESMQRVADGTFWFGDEFGPFLLHTDASGKMLEPPIPLPDFDNSGKELRSPQNPFNEESSTLRVMNAVRGHAIANKANSKIVFSPWHVMLDDKNAETFVDNRKAPPAGSGLQPASSEIHDVAALKAAGFPTVPYTINDKPRMLELMKLGVAGIISDRPDLLLQAVREFDANSDGAAGDFTGPDGLIDAAKFDAQGHRGARDLRPENTLPAMEAALDNLMTTLETDNGVSSNGIAILSHDPKIEAAKCRNADGTPYTAVDEVFIKNLTAAQIQSRFICDKVFRGPEQQNDPALSPASVAFAAARGLMHPYVMPTTQQLFDFAEFYIAYYSTGGPGTAHADAGKRKANAERVRYNIETKINPRAEFAARTIAAEPFAAAVAGVIAANRLESKADIQSFDFRTLLEVHKTFPAIRTVFLFGDFPIFADRSIEGSDDGTNLQDENGANTPWLAGLFWPYRATADSAPFKVARSGGFEGMALSTDGKKLYPLLEAPLVGATTSDAKTLLIHEFNLDRNVYTGKRFKYALDAGGTNIGDFILYNRKEGLVIERDGSQGKLDGFKKIYKIQLNDPEGFVGKEELVDLLAIKDRARISEPGQPGDVGLGKKFAFPFVTIEDVVVLNSKTLGVINDNNYPFSVGRHVGSGEPDDTEFIQIRLDERLDLDDKH